MAMTSDLYVISGDFRSGKTSVCIQLIEKWLQAGRRVAGIVSPARFEDGRKTGIYALDIASGQRKLLATSRPGEMLGQPLGIWTFDTEVLAWGNQLLCNIQETDALILDEIGPLELDRHQGWINGLNVFRTAKYQLGVVVIRPEYVDKFRNLGYLFKLVYPSQDLVSLLRVHLKNK